MGKQVIKLNENQFRNFIQENIVRVLNEMVGTDEISSDTLRRARDMFSKKYGSSFHKGEMTDKLETDKWGNPIHPKDGRVLADHYLDFNRAIHNAEYDEEGENELVKQARDIFFANKDYWEEIPDQDGGDQTVEAEIDGWKFNMYPWGNETVLEFETPDGETGRCKARKTKVR